MIQRIQILVSSHDRPRHLQAFISAFVLQHSSAWTLHIVQDGHHPDVSEVGRWAMDLHPNIRFHEFPWCGFWGFANRQAMVDKLVEEDGSWVMMTNDDNYFLPEYVSTMLDAVHDKPNVGLAYCDWTGKTAYYGHGHARPEPEHITMGQAMARFDYAKKVRITDTRLYMADSVLARDYNTAVQADGNESLHVPKILMVHN